MCKVCLKCKVGYDKRSNTGELTGLTNADIRNGTEDRDGDGSDKTTRGQAVRFGGGKDYVYSEGDREAGKHARGSDEWSDDVNYENVCQRLSSADIGLTPHFQRSHACSAPARSILQHLRAMDAQQILPRVPNVKFRVLIIGRANAGKTSIMQRVCDTTESPEIYRVDSSGARNRVRCRF
jgi:hypothetical protein